MRVVRAARTNTNDSLLFTGLCRWPQGADGADEAPVALRIMSCIECGQDLPVSHARALREYGCCVVAQFAESSCFLVQSASWRPWSCPGASPWRPSTPHCTLCWMASCAHSTSLCNRLLSFSLSSVLLHQKICFHARIFDWLRAVACRPACLAAHTLCS